jgi:hypothetical protein
MRQIKRANSSQRKSFLASTSERTKKTTDKQDQGFKQECKKLSRTRIKKEEDVDQREDEENSANRK